MYLIKDTNMSDSEEDCNATQSFMGSTFGNEYEEEETKKPEPKIEVEPEPKKENKPEPK